MRALTLHRPWPFIILRMGKRVENRPWKPWASVIGQRIALHAGKHWDPNTPADEPVTTTLATAQGIVGTAIVKGWVYSKPITRGRVIEIDYTYSLELLAEDALAAVRSRWFTGPYGWVLEDVHELPEPIPCKGALGLWQLPAAVEAQMYEPRELEDAPRLGERV